MRFRHAAVVAAIGVALAITSTVAGASSSSGAAADNCPCSLWTSAITPLVAASGDSTSNELGIKFRANTAGIITGVRFYKGSRNTGTHVGHLWSRQGALLRGATFTNETASGWQQVLFSEPVAITAGTTYVASYYAPHGHYSVDNGYFAAGRWRSGPLTALANGGDGPNGVYRYGNPGFPNSSYASSNYWVDVLFVPSASPSPSASTTPSPSGSPSAAPSPSGSPSAAPSPSGSPLPNPTPTPGCTGVAVPTSADLSKVVASYGSGTTFCLQAGTYSIGDAVSPKSFVSIVGQPGTVISGARVVTDWNAAGQGWSASGYLPPAYVDNGYNPCQDPTTNLCKLDEWLFRDNVRLKRVSSVAAVVSGTFYTDYAANRIYVGDNPGGHLLEVSRTRTAITSTAANVTLKGLRVEKFATRNQQAAIVANATGWSIVDCDVRFNHGAGIYGYADGLHVVASHVHHNGTLGIGVNDAKGILIERNELDHNNTDGSWVNDGESGGYKSTQTADTVRNNYVHENLGMGLWFDIGDVGSLIEGNVITGNAASGIRHEISHSAIIRDNILANNGLNRQQGDHSLYYGGNIDVDNSDQVEVYHNIVSGGDNGIALSMQSRGGSVLSDVYVHDNDVTMAGGVTGMVQSVGDTSYFSSRGNRFVRNRYALDSFVAPRFAWQNRSGGVSFWTAWQQDTTGTFVIGE